MSQTHTCKTCIGKNCNRKTEFQRCIHCNSKNNPECIMGEMPIESMICDEYLTTCVTGIDDHGYTHRRCSKEYTDQDIEFPDKLYEVCSENMCNTGIFPKNRLQCYRCNGDIENCEFMPSDSMMLNIRNPRLTPCDMFSTLDKCFTYFEGNTLH